MVKVCPAASGLKVVTAVSVRVVPPSVVEMVGAMEGLETVADKLVTLVFVEALVNVTDESEAGLLAQPAETPDVKLPPLKLPKIFVGVRLKMA